MKVNIILLRRYLDAVQDQAADERESADDREDEHGTDCTDPECKSSERGLLFEGLDDVLTKIIESLEKSKKITLTL